MPRAAHNTKCVNMYKCKAPAAACHKPQPASCNIHSRCHLLPDATLVHLPSAALRAERAASQLLPTLEKAIACNDLVRFLQLICRYKFC